MLIDWNHFTPGAALLGGAMIGLAAAAFIFFNGRIAGISGIVNNAIERRAERGWRLAFLAGLVVAAAAWFAWSGETARNDFPLPWLLAAGLLVGFGTRLGNGCTSGHGICGLARLSKRSLAAVVAFMASGIATVYVVRHVIGGMA